jgi:hypothetical protein
MVPFNKDYVDMFTKIVVSIKQGVVLSKENGTIIMFWAFFASTYTNI